MKRPGRLPSMHRSSARHRMAPGDVVAPREWTTIAGQPITVPAAGALTHLQFRRFASCPICNVHLRTVARRHDEIAAAGIREVVLFHSPREAMLVHQGQLPFAAVADPQQHLYTEFGVEFALRSVLHPRVWTAPLKPYAWTAASRERRAPGGASLSLRGQSLLGLPAEFLLAPTGRILAAHYGNHANDQWSIDQLLRQARELTRPGETT